ncbi:hypothetical protein M8494_04420 [Serratia ureilytica]
MTKAVWQRAHRATTDTLAEACDAGAARICGNATPPSPSRSNGAGTSPISLYHGAEIWRSVAPAPMTMS